MCVVAAALLQGCFFTLPFIEVETETDDGWWECYADCEICTDWDPETGICLGTKVVSANPDGDPKQICFDEDGTYASPNSQCQNKFYSNLMDAYWDGHSDLAMSCTYTSPGDTGPVHTSYTCDETPDETDPEGKDYTSGTETLRSTLLRVDGTDSTATITVGNDTATVGVAGWLQVTETPFRLIQVNLKATDPIEFGSDTWSNVAIINAGRPRTGSLDPSNGTFVVPVGGMVLDAVGTNGGSHYASDLLLSGVITGTLGATSFTANHSYAGSGGSVGLALAGVVVSRPPVAVFTTGATSGCSLAVDGTDSTDPDGATTIEHWQWYVNGYPAGSGGTTSLTLTSGTNLVSLAVVDSVGLVSESRASKVVEASSCTP